jgi:hypothetical protein
MNAKSFNGLGYAQSDGPPPSPLEHFYMAFWLSDSEDDVARKFIQRHGFHPPWLFEHMGNLLAGPVPAQKES